MSKLYLKIRNRPLWQKLWEVSDRCRTPLYLVGGVIRDYLAGKESLDSDFLVLGPVRQFAEKASLHLSGGKVVYFPRFKNAFFNYQGSKLEFSEARIPIAGLSEMEAVYGDLQGRDFTINAIAGKLIADEEIPLIDPFSGIEDFKNRILRTPDDSIKILTDDPIRILRAFRFAAKFKMEIDPGIIEASRKTIIHLDSVSGERIGGELWKILELPRPSEALKALYEIGALEKVLPEISGLAEIDKRGKFNHKNILLHTFKVVDNVAKENGDTITRFAALLHDIAKPMTKRFDPKDGFTFHGHEDLGARIAKKIGKRLKFSRERINLISKLILLHMRPVNLVSVEVTDSAIRRLVTQAGDDLERQLTLCRADITSGNPRKVKRYMENFAQMIARMNEVDEKDKLRAFQSPVRGEEIMEICDLKPGPAVGKIKRALESAILDGIIPNEHEYVRQYLVDNRARWLNDDFSPKELSSKNSSAKPPGAAITATVQSEE